MKVVFLKILIGSLIMVCTAPIFAVSQKQSTATVTSLNLMRHDIFKNVYSSPQGVETKKSNKIKDTINKIKKMVDLSFNENMKFKISSVKSGPLKQSVTQMFQVAPGIQTHDGLIGESSKGYGIKFTYKYD